MADPPVPERDCPRARSRTAQQLKSRRRRADPPAVSLRPAAGWPDRAVLSVGLGRVRAVIDRIAADASATARQPPGYTSKAAAFDLTQSLRALLAGLGVREHAVLTGPTDTDMTGGSERESAAFSPGQSAAA
jgi:NAD(P)-dependent dehydrogenase (short-subunit alcohol dehydrogenase family)